MSRQLEARLLKVEKELGSADDRVVVVLTTYLNYGGPLIGFDTPAGRILRTAGEPESDCAARAAKLNPGRRYLSLTEVREGTN